MKRIKFILLALITLLVFTLAGCTTTTNSTQTSSSNTTYPLTITDAYNEKVTIDKEPTKVISIAPELTEIIFSVGKGSELVGRTDYCDYPEEAASVASIGQITDPDLEKIIALTPDVVFASDLTKKEIIEKLRQANIKVVMINGLKSFEGVYDNITKIGNILNANAKANEVIGGMKKKVADVMKKVKGTPTPSVYYVVSYGQMGDWTAGKSSFTNSIIEMAGGVNAAADINDEYAAYSIEKLVEKNPDILICSAFFDTKKGIEATAGYEDLAAVKSGKLVEIDNNLIDRQGPRLADGLEAIAKIIHPELFN